MSADPPVLLAGLRDELVRAAVRRHRRRAARPRVAAAVLATSALLIGGALVLSGPRPARADVRVELTSSRVVVTLVDLEHEPHRIEARLRGVGLEVSVTAVPVGPSLVGRFVGDATSGALPPELRAVGAERASFAGFSLPIGWTGRLDLRVGRPAIGDEPYATFTDALAPGEPLACRPLVGRPAAEVAALLATTGLDVVFEAAAGSTVAIPLAAMAHSDHGRWMVVAADATSPRRVVVRIRDGRPPARPAADPC